MDDDPNVVRVAVDFLKFIGYRVDPVADGEEAPFKEMLVELRKNLEVFFTE
jgi:CheY-like chemotaxis protein